MLLIVWCQQSGHTYDMPASLCTYRNGTCEKNIIEPAKKVGSTCEKDSLHLQKKSEDILSPHYSMRT